MTEQDGFLQIRGARAGNLQNLDLALPHGAWTAVHGASGAGKSALLFGLLAPVSKRRFRLLEEPSALPGGGEAWLAPLADEVRGLHPVIAGAGEIPRGRRNTLLVDALDLWPLLEQAWHRHGGYRCTSCNSQWRPPLAADIEKLSGQWEQGTTVLVLCEAAGQERDRLLQGGWTRYRLEGRLQRLEEAQETPPAHAALLIDRFKWREGQERRWREAVDAMLARGEPATLVAMEQELAIPSAATCPQCAHVHQSHNWQDWSRRADLEDRYLEGEPWQHWMQASLQDWSVWVDEQDRSSAARRLRMLLRTGLGHLSANRALGTLSLGEGRRLELSSWIAQVRSGQTVLLDEPGMGLHGRERQALAGLLQELVAQGNTVFTADPAREFLEAAHHWLWLGPGGGPDGGTIVGQGPRATLPQEDWHDEAFLQEHAPAETAEAAVSFANLRHRYVDIPKLNLPLGRLVAFCGVSGSGKTTLIEQQLLPSLRGVEGAPEVTGRLPMGGVASLLERALRWSPWSTVATLSGCWAEVRQAFADGEEGRIRGLSAADLVARPRQGACSLCEGHGLDRDGLPCPQCDALGLREDLLTLRLRQRSLREWLTTPLHKLEKRLPARGRLRATVRHLIDLGLGERHLGERGRFLSLGERGRLALARALASARRDRPKLFVLDEPCLGLPVQEARKVVALLRRLCREGHSVWVVEHHEYLLRAADYLVELGPGAGKEGGKLVFAGTPSEVLQTSSATGKWLHERRQEAPPPPPPRPWQELPSAILEEDRSRKGRVRLEEELRRELAMRSPLLQDQSGSDAVHSPAPQRSTTTTEHGAATEMAWTPVAWPTAAPSQSQLLEVLGLEEAFVGLCQAAATPRCGNCGGAGPWQNLQEAVVSLGDQGTWLFVSPLPETFLAKEEHPSWLRAAGFRRFLRQGKSFRWTRQKEQALQAGDAVWLEELPLEDPDLVGRLRDLTHQADLLGEGVVQVMAADQPDTLCLEYRKGSCRDCARENVSMVSHLGGQSLSELREGRMQNLLKVVLAESNCPEVFRRAQPLLEASSLLALHANSRWRQWNEEEQRVARLIGLLLFPLEGVAILVDQALSGLSPGMAYRLGQAMVQGPGRFRFTDPEGYLSVAREEDLSLGQAEPSFADAPASFAWQDWCTPPRAEEGQDLRQALGVAEDLRQFFLRTEGARLAGWTSRDLDPRYSPLRCIHCKGRGHFAPHPALQVACGHCQGHGWQRALAGAEDRGLRWPDLGRERIQDLAQFFPESGRLGAVFRAAVELQLGEFALDSRLESLPRGVRMLAPLAGSAANLGQVDLAIGLGLPGWTSLEAAEISRTIVKFRERAASFSWRDRHPLLSTN